MYAGGSDFAGNLFDLNVLWLQARSDMQQRMEEFDKLRAENPGIQLVSRFLKGGTGDGNRREIKKHMPGWRRQKN